MQFFPFGLTTISYYPCKHCFFLSSVTLLIDVLPVFGTIFRGSQLMHRSLYLLRTYMIPQAANGRSLHGTAREDIVKLVVKSASFLSPQKGIPFPSSNLRKRLQKTSFISHLLVFVVPILLSEKQLD